MRDLIDMIGALILTVALGLAYALVLFFQI